ncbi:uncharacterized protein SPAPADRAFT_58953, partial [Spathaspora passalidarum NRRL Y-27907]
MSKREGDERVRSEKKVKLSKKEEIAIDSELLGQQSSYVNNNKEGEDASIAEAAVAAVNDSDQKQAQQQHQQQQQQQQQQAQQSQQQSLSYHQAYQQQQEAQGQNPFRPTTLPPTSANKPTHGSDEWHRQRRENHKEVERRRRESINVGIKELAALIPTNDTNKAQILQRAVEYIKRLKENENNNIEKWTLEKLLTEQAVSELSASNEKL